MSRINRAGRYQVDRCAALYTELGTLKAVSEQVGLCVERVSKILQYGAAQGWCTYNPTNSKPPAEPEQILADLRRVYAELGLSGSQLLTLAQYQQHGQYSHNRIYKLFVSFRNALKQAKLPTKLRKTMNRPSNSRNLPIEGGGFLKVYRPGDGQPRTCLKCDKTFASKCKANRICKPCTKANAWIEAQIAASFEECA